LRVKAVAQFGAPGDIFHPPVSTRTSLALSVAHSLGCAPTHTVERAKRWRKS
jgi:hypothetical protein